MSPEQSLRKVELSLGCSEGEEGQPEVYLPGEQVCGFLHSQVTESIVQEATVAVIGEYYTDITGCGERKKEFFSQIVTLNFSAGGEGTRGLAFRLLLPPDLPSSLAVPIGGIRYRLRGRLVLPTGSAVQVERFISVIAISRLPDKEEEGCRVMEVEPHLFPCCCSSVSCQISLSSRNLLAGTEAIVNVRISNPTSRYITLTSLVLVQKVRLKKENRSWKYEVSKLERGSIMPRKQQVWLSERFLIPPLPPTSSSVYFDISYFICMCMQKSSSTPFKVKIPVNIGNAQGSEEIKSWKSLAGRAELLVSGEQIETEYLPYYVCYTT